MALSGRWGFKHQSIIKKNNLKPVDHVQLRMYLKREGDGFESVGKFRSMNKISKYEQTGKNTISIIMIMTKMMIIIMMVMITKMISTTITMMMTMMTSMTMMTTMMIMITQKQ